MRNEVRLLSLARGFCTFSYAEVREGQYEEADAPAHAVHVEAGFAEVRLDLAGSPDELEVAVGGGPPLAPHLGDVVAHGRLAARDAVLVAQPLPYPARGVAPLVSVSRIIIQPLLDKGAVRVQLAN